MVLLLSDYIQGKSVEKDCQILIKLNFVNIPIQEEKIEKNKIKTL